MFIEPFKEANEHKSECLNEGACLLVMYGLLCFTGGQHTEEERNECYFVSDGATKDHIGVSLAVITSLSCLFNSVSLIYAIGRYLKRKFIERKIKNLLQKRTESQTNYGIRLE